MGINIGLIGLTTIDTKLMSFPDNIKGIDFLDEIESLRKYIPIVKDAGADIIIVLGHMGLPYDPAASYEKRYVNDSMEKKKRYYGWDSQEILHHVEGIDLLVGGHMHKGFAEPWVDPVTQGMAIQGYAFGSNLGWITLKIDEATKTLSGYELPSLSNGLMITMFEDEFPLDPEINAAIEANRKLAEKGMDDVIGIAGVHLHRQNVEAQSPMGNTVADAMRLQSNADFSFLNLGGIRAEIGVGPVTYRDVFSVMPFDNQLVSFECDGRFLKQIIETRIEGSRAGMIMSGAEVVFSRTRENFDRITKLLIGGEDWDPDKTYTVATTDFLMEGNAGLTLLTKIPDESIMRNELNLRDAIVNHFKQNSPIKTRIDNRWVRVDSSEPEDYLRK
jgi:2',3'-cyclic-nucleotide 2'-phosphodiesterase (5'-nucleotidase family)